MQNNASSLSNAMSHPAKSCFATILRMFLSGGVGAAQTMTCGKERPNIVELSRVEVLADMHNTPYAVSRPVRNSVVDGSNGSVAFIIQGAIRHSSGSEESPHICIAPVQDGIHTHEGWPISAAGTEHFLAKCIWITSAASTTTHASFYLHVPSDKVCMPDS